MLSTLLTTYNPTLFAMSQDVCDAISSAMQVMGKGPRHDPSVKTTLTCLQQVIQRYPTVAVSVSIIWHIFIFSIIMDNG